MSKTDEFKTFVKTKPSLISFVRNGDMTWQGFYELWFLYGSDHEVWNTYNGSDDKSDPKDYKDTNSSSGVNDNYRSTSSFNNTSKIKQDNFGLNDVFNMLKKVDMNVIKNNISGIQKAITLFQEMTTKGSVADKVDVKAAYNPRPIYRRFED